MLSLARITELFTALLEHAILGGFSSDETGISYNINLLTAATKIFQTDIRPTKPRFHELEPRSFRVSAIFEYGVCITSKPTSKGDVNYELQQIRDERLAMVEGGWNRNGNTTGRPREN